MKEVSANIFCLKQVMSKFMKSPSYILREFGIP